MTNFTYGALDLRQIRLVDILPGPGLIRCRIRQVSLDHHEPYEALSYCWGNSKKKAKILINDSDFFITPNLHGALSQLREHCANAQPRTLWVDAICINQDDEAERNIQVQLMGEIYSSCQRVLIWLGRHNVLTRLAVQGVQYMSSKEGSGDKFNYFDWKKNRRHEKSNTARSSLLRPSLDLLDTLIGGASINSLFCRHWFTRVWTIQELALSPRAIVVCGKYTIDWELIRKAHAVSRTNFDVQNHLGTILRFRDWPGSHKDDILSYMLMAWHKDCGDRKDKLYGLIGLLSPQVREKFGIVVDYASDTQSIYTNFTRRYLLETGNLQVLAVCRGCKPVRPTEDTARCPSWAIDHMYDKDREPLPDHLLSWSYRSWGQESLADVGGTGSMTSNPPPASIEFHDDLLGLCGFALDTITAVSITNMPARTKVGSSYLGGGIRSWMSAIAFGHFYLHAREICLESLGHSFDIGTIWQVLRATNDTRRPMMDSVSSQDETNRWQDVDRLLRFAAPCGLRVHLVESIAIAVVYIIMLIRSGLFGLPSLIQCFAQIGMTKQRRFFVTKQRYIGLAPREAEVGDVILLLKGHTAPALARSAGTHWMVVGECYVHGFIVSEAFDEEKSNRLWFQ